MSELLAAAVGAKRSTVPALLEAQEQARPDAPFLLSGERRWSYAEALAEARAMAGALSVLGAGPGQRVASFLGNRPETFWAWFGTHFAGAVYVALNRAHRGEILADMLRRSGATVLVTDREALADLPAPEEVGVASYLIVDGPPAGADPALVPYLPAPAASFDRPPLAPSDLASILFTSGTTGRAKAVAISHNHLCRGGARFAESLEQTSDDRWHAWMPMFHIFGQLHVTMATLAAGGSLALYPTFSRSRFWDQVRASRSTIVGGLGNMMRMLWTAPDRDANRDNPVRVALIATPPLEIRDQFAAHFQVRLVDSYGMTEAEPVTVPRPGEDLPPGAQGIANPDFEVAILDPEGNRARPGEKGEIAVRPKAPDVMFQGYEGDGDATVAAWKDLWFHTGDWGRLDAEGFLYLVDRRRYVIRMAGENVSPSEVEAIIRQHPAVADCAVVGVPAELGDEEIVATVVAAEGSDPAPADLHEFCRERMARFMVPRYIAIRPELPYSELGKVDREALQREGAAGAWDARGMVAVDGAGTA